MPRRDTAFERFRASKEGWFTFHGNMKLCVGDRVKATLFDEWEGFDVKITKDYTFDRFYCVRMDGEDKTEYLLDKTLVTEIYIDDAYRRRRKRLHFH